MRAYSALEEELVRANRALARWASAGLLPAEQAAALAEPGRLRRSHGLLRLLVALFTFAALAAWIGLGFTFLDGDGARGLWSLVTSALAYGCAEWLVARRRLYRCGIEEGLALGGGALFCVGTLLCLAPMLRSVEHAIPWLSAGVLLYLYLRFGYLYAAVGAIGAVVGGVADLSSSVEQARWILAALFAGGLLLFRPLRRRHRDDFLDEEYGFLQALLWLGLYLSINLWASRPELFDMEATTGWRKFDEYPRAFYFATQAATILLPVLAVRQGLRERDRALLDIGIILALLTLVTNKPYLGWMRKPWDPILLGCGLIAGAWTVRRWLARGVGAERHGYRATRLVAEEAGLGEVATVASLLVRPDGAHSVGSPDDFRGGTSGGGGASGGY